MNACTAITRNRVCGRPSRLAAVAASAVPSSNRITSSDSTWRSRSALARDRSRCRATVRAPSANAVSAAPFNGALHSTHTDPINPRPGAHCHHHASGHSVIGSRVTNSGSVGARQMGVHAAGVEECAQLLGCLSFDDESPPAPESACCRR